MTEAEVKKLCAALQRQPLFHLSLHSKELFHSNFLGWLCDARPVAVAEALAPWVPEAGTNRLDVLRERSHLDLAVQLPGRAPLVVEDKVFSPPDESHSIGTPRASSPGSTTPSCFCSAWAHPPGPTAPI